MKRIAMVVLASVACAAAALAELVPVHPVEGAEVPVQTDEALALSGKASYEARVSLAKKNKKEFSKNEKEKWRTAPPVILKWRATKDEHGPWKITISKTPDFKEPRV